MSSGPIPQRAASAPCVASHSHARVHQARTAYARAGQRLELDQMSEGLVPVPGVAQVEDGEHTRHDGARPVARHEGPAAAGSAIGPVPLTKGASRGTNAGQKAPGSAYTRSWNRTNSSIAAESAGTSTRGPILPHYAGPQPSGNEKRPNA